MKRLASKFLRKFSKTPLCEPVPYSFSIHGKNIEDSFRWLHDVEDRKVQRYIRAENEFFDRYFQLPTVEPYLKEVKEELNNTIEENPGSGIPEYAHGFYYYTREEPGMNFPLFCRRKSLESPEHVFLDVNQEGENHDYISVRTPVISVDQKKVAFARGFTAEEKYHGIIRCMETKKILSRISSVFSIVFTSDSNHIIYTRQDHLRRPHKVFLHKIGTEETSDELIYQEDDDAFFLDITQSKDNKWIVISANSKDSSEVRILKSSDIHSKPILVHKRTPNTKLFLDHAENRFYCVTNKDEAHNFKLIVANSSTLLSKAQSSQVTTEDNSLWSEMVPHRTNASILDVDIFKNNIVTYVSDNGRHQIIVYDQQNIRATPFTVPLPAKTGYVEPGGNVDYNSNQLRFSFSSPIHPEMVYDFDLSTKKLNLLKETKIKGFSPEEVSCKRISVTATDGTKIPVTLTRSHASFDKRSELPILLNVYGAYGHNIEPMFRAKYQTLWNRGWTVATVHVRGGGEKGELWHQQGTKLNKGNSFTDFIDCATFIRESRKAHPEKICAASSSAGGLVIGAACNMNPSLFNSVIMKVPFVDCLNSMLNEDLPLTICEYPEWGNPSEDIEIFDKMQQYDPYLNVRNTNLFPSIFATTSTLDYQVPFWGPLKWVAKIRNTKQYNTKKDLILHISENTSHGGDGGFQASNYASAKELSFLLHQTNSPIKSSTNKLS